jgi:predicted subunit of tRNA(5-methylaminomethyl-2-thiouridylate) methyltransferase
VQSQDDKERQLIQELKEQKVETASANSESKSKYEKEIREMSTKVKELTEQVFELENQLKDEEQNGTIQR